MQDVPAHNRKRLLLSRCGKGGTEGDLLANPHAAAAAVHTPASWRVRSMPCHMPFLLRPDFLAWVKSHLMLHGFVVANMPCSNKHHHCIQKVEHSLAIFWQDWSVAAGHRVVHGVHCRTVQLAISLMHTHTHMHTHAHAHAHAHAPSYALLK